MSDIQLDVKGYKNLKFVYKGTEHSHDNPLWTECVFDGLPPPAFDSWMAFLVSSSNAGLFKRIRISALSEEEYDELTNKGD